MKNIFVTGCGSGLGKSLLEVGEKYECNIFPHFRNFQNDISGDINEKSFLSKLPEFLEKNSIDVFVNNAAIYKNQKLLDTTDQEIIDIINTNLVSQILIIKKVVHHFKRRGSGLIININSLAGKTSSAKESIYCASKAGLYAFSKALQLELIGDMIEIVDIFPGAMKTRMCEHRENYDSLMEPNDISNLIFDLIFNHQNIFVNEIVVRKKSFNLEKI